MPIQNVEIELGGQKFNIPPIPIAGARKIKKMLKEQTANGTDSFDGMLEVILFALQLAQPDMTQEKLDALQLTYIDEASDAFTTIMKQAGLELKPKADGADPLAPTPILH